MGIRLRLYVVCNDQMIGIAPHQFMVARTRSYQANRPTYPQPPGACDMFLENDAGARDSVNLVYMPHAPGHYDIFAGVSGNVGWTHVGVDVLPSDPLHLEPLAAYQAEMVARCIMGL